MDIITSNSTLLSSDDSWSLWAVILLIVALAVSLERKYKWAGRISAALLCILFGILVTSLNILPTESPVYDTISVYCIPVSVCMMLLTANLKKIFRQSGKMFISFHICVVAAMLGGTVYCLLLRTVMPEADKLAAGELASMIGSTPNAVAVYNTVGLSNTSFATMLVVGNFVFALVMMATMGIPSSKFFKKYYLHPHEDALRSQANASDTTSINSTDKAVTLWDVALIIGITFCIVAVAAKISAILTSVFAVPDNTGIMAQLPGMILGNHFIITTILTTVLVTIFPKFFEKLNGTQMIGTFIIYVYFVTIGTGANLIQVLTQAPMLFAIMLTPNIIFFAVTLIVGKMMRMNIEELCIASIASLGGPSTAIGMAGAKGYKKLMLPGLMVGIWGNVIGTIIGLFMYAVFSFIL